MVKSYGGNSLSDSVEDEMPMGIVFSTDPADFHYMKLNVPCQGACPAWTNVPAYIRSLYEDHYDDSYEINRVVNILPGVLGRVCSRPCERMCRHGERELGEPVSICHIKRAAADFKRSNGIHSDVSPGKLGKSVCIIGAGPAGLALAHDLAVMGFSVEILEALDQPGGMLMYGIPEFRLPRQVLKSEIDSILGLGIKLRTGVRVGQDVSVEQLLAQYNAVSIAAGCYTPKMLGIPGEDLDGVMTGLDFVMELNSGRPPRLGKNVVVLGAGFTAFDCARLALRFGADRSEIFIRATEDDLRVTEDEIHEAKREGVVIRALSLSTRIVGTGRVEGVEFLRTKLGEIRSDGRRKAVPIDGSEFLVEADSVIVAVGQGAQPIPGPGDKNARQVIIGDVDTYRTTTPGLYVAGDFMTGPKTVIDAIAAGRKAASRISQDLIGKKSKEWVVQMEDSSITDRDRVWDFIPRQSMPTILPVQDRLVPPNIETEIGYSKQMASEEARRCYLCYLHYEIDINRCIYCRYCIDVAPRDCIKLVKEVVIDDSGAVTSFIETTKWNEVNAVVIDNARCIRCGACVRVCPVNCISVSKVQLVERVLLSGSN